MMSKAKLKRIGGPKPLTPKQAQVLSWDRKTLKVLPEKAKIVYQELIDIKEFAMRYNQSIETTNKQVKAWLKLFESAGYINSSMLREWFFENSQTTTIQAAITPNDWEGSYFPGLFITDYSK